MLEVGNSGFLKSRDQWSTASDVEQGLGGLVTSTSTKPVENHDAEISESVSLSLLSPSGLEPNNITCILLAIRCCFSTSAHRASPTLGN
jgi:hypothetical protein